MSLQETLASIAKSGLPLQGKLDALKAEFETNIAPAPVVEALHGATDELIASGAPGKALKAGDVAPAFTLPDADGATCSRKVRWWSPFIAGLVPLLQLRPHRPRGRSGRNRGAGRRPGRSLAADRAQQPQVAAPERAGLPDPQRQRRRGRRAIRRSLDRAELSARNPQGARRRCRLATSSARTA